MRTYLAAILIASTIPGFAFAQIEPLGGLTSGARIRITAPSVSESERIGRLDSVGPDSIQFRPDSRPFTRSVSIASVRTIEVSRGMRTRKSEYALVGALAGAVIGYISSNHGGQGIGTGRNDPGQNALVGAVAGVGIGGALGWWYGGKRKVENWQLVDKML